MSRTMYKLNRRKEEIDGEKCISYGITVCEEHTVSGISTDRAFVADMVKKFNENKLDAIHLKDVIEDAINLK